MPALIAVLGVGVIAVAVVSLLPRLLAAQAKTNKLSECRQIQSRLDGERVQGGDQVKAAQLESELRRCYEDANAQGANIDPAEPMLDACASSAAQILAEWSHYRSTDYADAVKRNNTRGSILRAGEDMVQCLRRAVATTSSVTTLDKIEAFTREQILQSHQRTFCFLNSESGCSRYGLDEPHNNDRATDELLRIGAPLGAIEVYGIYDSNGWSVWDQQDVAPFNHEVCNHPDRYDNFIKSTADCGFNHVNTNVAQLQSANALSVLNLIRQKRRELMINFTVTPESASRDLARSFARSLGRAQ